MTDITPDLNAALKSRNATPVIKHRYSLDQLDEFLKEAYSINARIADLTAYLRAIRPSYLSTAPAARQGRHDGSNALRPQRSGEGTHRHLTDAERTSIDAEAKSVLRQLYSAVSSLSQAEQVRQDTVSNVALRKRAQGGLGALGRWAAGGAVTAKSPEEEREDGKQKSISAHREGVLWYLQRKLEEAGNFQGSMMEIRIQREVEKSKSVLWKSRASNVPYERYETDDVPDSPMGGGRTQKPGQNDAEAQLSGEQMQMFAEENQEMLRHYEDTLDQVRTAEKSLLEISELQTTLAANLTMQSAHVDQLVQDSFFTTENVGRGNKELKRASERPSTARLLFHGTCAFCAFLVVWDLVF